MHKSPAAARDMARLEDPPGAASAFSDDQVDRRMMVRQGRQDIDCSLMWMIGGAAHWKIDGPTTPGITRRRAFRCLPLLSGHALMPLFR
ncbi:hypothetical protein H5407_16880 [Mitsuaria sp. WAJ17]|uniref:hypothetical protein n=1 Tax=Mitsuaria sp. WAJ17 TaxID=2761452 RepID=UPI001603BE3B|nr:hypothetical protein [Mitsuaria sp. WAJ17]MBB2486905.1 hypothetical protein [Mitsuaria sp. WAJ17]